MSVAVVAVLLGIGVVLLIRAKSVRAEAAILCIVFGVVLGATPVGPAVNSFLTAVGTFLWDLISSW